LYFHEVIYDSLLNDIGNKFLLRAKEYHYWLDSSYHMDNYELLLNDCCNENFKEWKVKLAYLNTHFSNVQVLVDVVCTLCTAPEGEKKTYSIYKAYIDFDDPWFYEVVNDDFRPFFFQKNQFYKNTLISIISFLNIKINTMVNLNRILYSILLRLFITLTKATNLALGAFGVTC
jgi:hypothetical protein